MDVSIAEIEPKNRALSSEVLEPDRGPDVDPSREVSRKRQSLSDLFTIVSGGSKLLDVEYVWYMANNSSSSLPVALP